jgi:hypothetical protein
MVACEPPHLLELRWGDDETLRFELTPTDGGSGTQLRFANTFGDVGKAARDAAGWHACLDLLVHLVDGGSEESAPTDRWREVHPWYVAHLPPEASTIGPPAGAG